MKFKYLSVLAMAVFLISCGETEKPEEVKAELTGDWAPAEAAETKQIVDDSGFAWMTEQFADKKIVRYQIPGWENLSAKQKTLVYYLDQAGKSGRDIMYDQNYRHNLEIRKALENVYNNFDGDKGSTGWAAFTTYLKNIWFSNGIHHHYANTKFAPGFSIEYFDEICAATSTTVSDEIKTVMFDASVDNKKVELDPEKGLVEGSAVNFYGPDVTTADAEAYFASIMEESRAPISYGLNSRLVKNVDGEIEEEVYKVGGKYGAALEQVVYWLKKAENVAENDKQAAAFRNLIKFYETGDLKAWDIYNINWVGDTEGDIDYINGFVEVYNDPLGYTGSYETIVEIKDFEASSRMQVFMENIAWFEANSPFMDEHKKKDVKGIVYNVVNVASEAGDASPSTPIGVNLPNANWIRVQHGSKSVSLGNIVSAYEEASGSGVLDEFAHDAEEIELSKAHSSIAGSLHTALHEVVGHASGQLEEGVGTPKETIKNYASTLEEGRADLVALYFIYDQKLVDLGLMETLDVGRAEYDSYIRNGMLTQLRRLEIGADIEEAHMRNRAWISHWVFEQAQADNVIEKVMRDGKTFYNITDYDKLRVLFGQLLKEVQRIKSQGDFEAAKALVETYGVKVDPAIHQEIMDRTAALESAPYGGFINPELVPVMGENDEIIDVKVEYPEDFSQQMVGYSKNYNFLSK